MKKGGRLLSSDLGVAASLGIEIASAVFLGAGLGYFIDTKLKSGPWGMVIGLLIGAVAGFWNAYKFAVKQDERT